MPSFVVTGASRGIGLELVRQLSAGPENTVFALIRNPSTSAQLDALNRPNVHTLLADVINYKTLGAAAAEVSKITDGTLDVLINNAAFIDKERAHLTLGGYPEGGETDLEHDMKYSFEVNVIGVVHTVNAFLPLIRKGTTKKVITFSTGLADTELTIKAGLAPSAPYSIAKAALNMAVAKYAAEYKSEGIIFLAISPGLVNTADKPPTQQDIERATTMIQNFLKYAPTWDGKPLTPEQSVKYMLKVFDRVTLEDSGAFLSHFGNKQWL